MSMVRMCVFSIIPADIFTEHRVDIDTFAIIEFPEFLTRPESVECRVALRMWPHLGEKQKETIHIMELRTRFAGGQWPYLLLIKLDKEQEMDREMLTDYINSLSTKKLRKFLKERRM